MAIPNGVLNPTLPAIGNSSTLKTSQLHAVPPPKGSSAPALATLANGLREGRERALEEGSGNILFNLNSFNEIKIISRLSWGNSSKKLSHDGKHLAILAHSCAAPIRQGMTEVIAGNIDLISRVILQKRWQFPS